jgi:HTH-type transcriptional regulator / antitoxin HipB
MNDDLRADLDDFPIRTPEQLIPLFTAFRKRRKLSQMELAQLIGVSQQTVSQLERAPNKATLERLMRALTAMDVELVLRSKAPAKPGATPASAKKESW